MSILFRCPHCQKQLKAPDTAVGKTAKCQACNGTCTVPAANASAFQQSDNQKAQVQTPPNSETIKIICSSCTRSLRAPASSQGKKVRCSCGAVLAVPAASPSSSQSSGTSSQNSGSWLDGLPDSNQPGYPPSSSPFSFDSTPQAYPAANTSSSASSYYSPSPSYTPSAGAYEQPYSQSNYASPPPATSSSSNMYLANAAAEMSQSSYVERGETWSVDWAKIGGGVLMMVGAAVWFFVGLAANVIYFYPPVLFIIGLVTVLKGFFDGD